MSADLYAPHLLVIPEDDANRHIVNGFMKHMSIKFRQIQIEAVANGWSKALKVFSETHIRSMRKYAQRYVLILIDSDGRKDRIARAKRGIPPDLADRVFIMGSLTTPEKLAATLGMSREQIGEAIANECRDRRCEIWSNALLAHNLPEWRRMQDSVCPALWDV